MPTGTRSHDGWILVIDDDPVWREHFRLVLEQAGFRRLRLCEDGAAALAVLEEQAVELVLLDLGLPRLSGYELLCRIQENMPEVPVVLVTAENDVRTAVNCMKHGAFDYLVKPVERQRLLTVVQRALEIRALRRQNESLRLRVHQGELENAEVFAPIVTRNRAMLSLFQYVEAIAPTDAPVLITGETGVGKELIAQAIHRLGQRSGDIVAVNVAGIDDHVFSDTLFGHTRGAFTGADDRRAGLVECATNGTLFLDEIGDLSLTSQVKLLRLLQEGEYTPLGADAPQHTNARVVVATRRDLEQLQRDGRFRPDLYYRLRRHHVHVLPLRERLDDLPLLLDHFLHHAAEVLGKRKPSPPDGLLPLLSTHRFPGNVRELESMVFDAVSRHRGRRLSLQSFRELLREGRAAVVQCADTEWNGLFAACPRLPTLKEAQHLLVQEALRRADGKQSLAAHMLGISRQALSQRLRNHSGKKKVAQLP